MEAVIPVAVVIAYVILLTFVALRARTAHEFEEFSLAKRSLPLALVFGSLAATYIGPTYSISFVGKGFNSGFLFLGIGLAFCIQNVLVGIFIAPRLRALKNCHTLGDAIGQKYDRKCHLAAGIISVGLCAGFSAVMAKAGGIVITDAIGLNNWSSVAIVVGITALYTTYGGLRASVITDAFQFTAFATILPITLLLAFLFNLDGGAKAFFDQASEATKAGMNSISAIEIIGLVTAFLLGETLIPPYANRALASKSTTVSRNGFVMAGIFSIFWFMVMVSLGIMARINIETGTDEDLVLLKLVRGIMPDSGYALLLVVLISVIMSSLDSLLNAGAVAFTQDIIQPFVKLENGSALSIGRAATIAIAITAAVGAVFVPSIIDGLLICYSIWAPAILPALIIGLIIKHPRPRAGILSMASGTIVAILFEFDIIKSEIPAIIPGLAAAILAYILGHLSGHPKNGI